MICDKGFTFKITKIEKYYFILVKSGRKVVCQFPECYYSYSEAERGIFNTIRNYCNECRRSSNVKVSNSNSKGKGISAL